MTNNKDALNEMKRLAGLQLNEYTIAEAPKKSAAPAADDGRQYYRDPGDGAPLVPLGTKSQAGPGLYGDEKGRYDKMPGDNTRFFSTPGPEAAKPAPAAPAPAPKANVTKDQLDKFRQDTGNPNATLGQYLNAQQGKTARKGGANDPDVIQQKLGPGQDAYRPVPGAPAPQGKAAPATPAPLAPGGQFAPGSTMGMNPPAERTPPGQMSRTPGGPEINTPIPGFGPNAAAVPPLKGPAGPDARAGSYPDRLPGAVNNTPPPPPNPRAPRTGVDPYSLGGGKDQYIKPAPVAPNPTQSTLGGSGNEGDPKPTPTLRNPAPVTGGTGDFGKTGVPIDKVTSIPGGASDLGLGNRMKYAIPDDPSFSGYKDRQDAADFKRPLQKLQKYYDDTVSGYFKEDADLVKEDADLAWMLDKLKKMSL